MRKRRKKKKKLFQKQYNVDIPSLSTHFFSNKNLGFNTSNIVSEFLRFKKISYKLVKNLDGEGEYKDGQYNCNKIFFSNCLPEKRKVVAYWDYGKETLYY